MLKNLFGKFKKEEKVKKVKPKKNTQGEFDFDSLDDLQKEKKVNDSKFGFAKDSKFAKDKEKVRFPSPNVTIDYLWLYKPI